MTTLYHLARWSGRQDYLWDEDYEITALFVQELQTVLWKGILPLALPPQETIKVWSGGAIKILCNSIYGD